MKKAFAVIVCLWTLFGICGCGTNPASETETVSSSETEMGPLRRLSEKHIAEPDSAFLFRNLFPALFYQRL